MTHAFETAPTPFPGSVPPSAGGTVPRPGWWQRHWKWAVPSGVALLFAGIVGFVVLILAIVFGVIRSTEVYRTALTEAKTEPAVIAAVGVPIEPGFLVLGNIEVTPSSGYADLAIPIEGPDARATIHVVAEKSRGQWAYSTLEVTVAGSDDTIDLLSDW